MKRFLLTTGCFALLLLLALAAGEVYVRSLPNAAKAKDAWLTRHAGQVETLILGSSHTYYGVAPELLGAHAYNAAQVSQTLRYDNFILEHYPMPRLKLVVLPVSDFTFYEDFESGRDWFLAIRYRLYMHCPYHARLSRYGFEVAAFKPFAEKLKSLWQPRRMRWSALGQGLEYSLSNRPPHWDNGEARATANHYAENACVELNEKYLASIWRRTRAHRGARLVLISTPLRPDYRAAQWPAQVRATDARVARFVATHPGTLYLDYRTDTTFGPRDFYDADHLSLEGSHHFSQRLARDIKTEIETTDGGK